MNEELKSIDSEETEKTEATKNTKEDIITELPNWSIEPPITIKRGEE